ncbi:MAG: DUF255 domain-containing protein [Candidatus Hydrogenedentes bacterium]|nr:DUF255 domain-containing protein [Candidatus Hydrogenedentota bacterium]
MGHHHRNTMAALAMLVLATACRPEPGPPIPWRDSLPLALEAARREEKPVFLYVTAAWCNICRRVERDSFGDPNLASALESLVPVKVDIDQFPWVGQRYDVAAVPAFVILDPRGRVLSRTFGFHDSDALQTLTERAVSEVAHRE